MAAVLAKGTTVIDNAAREPEIADLAAFLNRMGAQIARRRQLDDRRSRASTELRAGRAHGHPRPHRGGDVPRGGRRRRAARSRCDGARPDHMDMLMPKLGEMGMRISPDARRPVGDGAGPAARRSTSRRCRTRASPPTTCRCSSRMLAVADGVGIVTENLFAGRFRYVDELVRMGADIRTEGHHAVVAGVERLSGAPVRRSDIRAGAALVVAGLGPRARRSSRRPPHRPRLRRPRRTLAALGADVEPTAIAERRPSLGADRLVARRSARRLASLRSRRTRDRAGTISISSQPPWWASIAAGLSRVVIVGEVALRPVGTLRPLRAVVRRDGHVREQVEEVIEVIRPAIQADGGDIVLATSTRTPASCTVELIGACVSLPGVDRDAEGRHRADHDGPCARRHRGRQSGETSSRSAPPSRCDRPRPPALGARRARSSAARRGGDRARAGPPPLARRAGRRRGPRGRPRWPTRSAAAAYTVGITGAPGRGQVDPHRRARRAASARSGERGRACSPSTRRRRSAAARSSATGCACRTTPPTPACSSARWRPAGHLGGLALATPQAVRVLDAVGQAVDPHRDGRRRARSRSRSPAPPTRPSSS